MSCAGKVRDWINAHGLIRRGDTVIAALSGGPDSAAMLSILASLSDEVGFALSAAYLDHGIRENTGRERRIAEILCGKLGVPLVCGASDVPAAARKQSTGLEETAREVRYEFLLRVCSEAHAPGPGSRACVALGHNRDDQVETVLLHLIRGTGMRGLSGMPARRGIFIRPVLCCTGSELKAHCRENGIRYAVDPSNRDTTFLRNRIRHRLLPILRRDFNPSIDEALLRLAENAAGASEFLESAMTVDLPPKDREGAVTMDVSGLADLPDYSLYLLVDTLLRERFGVYRDIGRVHHEAVRRLVRSGRSGSMTRLPHGVAVSIEQGTARFEQAPDEVPPSSGPDELVIPGDGEFELPGWNMSVSVGTVPPGGGSAPRSTRYFALLGSVRFPLRVRTRQSGDRLVPFGMKGKRKLSDIMIDRKVPLRMRDRLPVFEDRGGIVWVPGVVTAERTRISSSTRRITRLELEHAG